jgi:hypothetical protein
MSITVKSSGGDEIESEPGVGEFVLQMRKGT